MLISNDHKTIFVHNQKTAGMSVEDYFEKHVPDVSLLLPRHSYAEDAIRKIGIDKWNEYYSFGFVLNPWARLVSWYTMIIERPNEGKNNSLWTYVRQNSDSFDEFLIYCTSDIVDSRDDNIYIKSFVRNQIDYFTDQDGKRAVSFIGKFEKLNEDFETVKKQAHLPDFALGRENASSKKDYRKFYNDSTRELVATRFERDIQEFNYTFDDAIV